MISHHVVLIQCKHLRTLLRLFFLSYSHFIKSIPYGEQSDITCTVGKLPENIPKNRFKTTFPCKNYKLYTNTTFEGIAFSQFAYVSFD